MNDVHLMQKEERVLPLNFEVIGYPSRQCTGAAQSDDQRQDQGDQRSYCISVLEVL